MKRNKLITLEESLLAQLAELAERDDRSVNYLINKILTEYVEKNLSESNIRSIDSNRRK